MITFKQVVLVCLIILTIISIGLTAEKYYWQYWDFKPIIVYGIKIINPDKKAHPGGQLYYEIDFDKKMNVYSTITRQISDTYEYKLVPYCPELEKLGRQQVKEHIPIPRVAQYGTFILTWTDTFEVGPEKRKISVSVVSEPFEVVPDPNERKGKTGATGATGAKGMTGATGATGKQGGIKIFGK